MLWLVLADRLGWPVHAVMSTKHYFLRYEDDRLSEKNIDPTAWGGYVPDENYKADGLIPDRAVENGVYLRSLSRREYLASLLSNHIRHYEEREPDLEKARDYLELALSIDPAQSPTWWNAGLVYLRLAQQLDSQWENELQAAYDQVKTELLSASVRNQQANAYPRPQPRSTHSTSFIQSPTPGFPVPEPYRFQNPAGIVTGFDPVTGSINPPVPPGNRDMMVHIDPELVAELNEQLQEYARELEAHYGPKIHEYAIRSRDCRQKALDLGISFKFSEEYLIKVEESIELQRQNENQQRPRP